MRVNPTPQPGDVWNNMTFERVLYPGSRPNPKYNLYLCRLSNGVPYVLGDWQWGKRSDFVTLTSNDAMCPEERIPSLPQKGSMWSSEIDPSKSYKLIGYATCNAVMVIFEDQDEKEKWCVEPFWKHESDGWYHWTVDWINRKQLKQVV